MTKKQLVDYVMTTPNNPNLAVLNSLIDRHDEEVKNGGGVSSEEVAAIVKENFPGGVGYYGEGETTIFDGTVTNDTRLSETNFIEIGKEYTVIWDGATYNCTAFAYEEWDGAAMIGSPYGDYSEYPFCINEDYPETYIACADDKEHTLSISTLSKVARTIDPKFISFVDVFPAKTIMPETELTTKSNNYMGYTVAMDIYRGDIISGEKYKVTVNGVEYECVAYAVGSNGQVALGNASLFSNFFNDVSEEPFAIVDVWESDGVFYFKTNSETASDYSVSVELVEKVLVQEDCIPKSGSGVSKTLKIYYDGSNYHANMSYEELFDHLNNHTLEGGWYEDDRNLFAYLDEYDLNANFIRMYYRRDSSYYTLIYYATGEISPPAPM